MTDAPSPNPRPAQPRRWLRRVALAFDRLGRAGIVAGAVLIGYLLIGYVGGNVAPVVEGEVWRAGQLSGPQLQRFIEAEGIRSVINLRGENTGSDWYDAEVAATAAAGARHIDFRMSSRQQLDRAQADALVALMREAPKPLLIHCEGGADRSSLAAALYAAEVAGQPRAVADWQISPIFGYLATPRSPKWAMTDSWERLAP